MFLPLSTCLLVCGAIPVIASQYIVEVLEPPRLGVRHTVQKCDATGATFGADIVSFSFGTEAIGCVSRADPENACTPVKMVETNGTECLVNFAVVPRGQCSFSEKAYYVQRASESAFSALIVFNDEGKPPVDMAGGKFAEQIRIPVVMVSYICMKGMMERYPPSKGYLVQIKISPGYYDLFRYLIPFVVVVGFCFTVLIVSLLIRLCRERRRIARKRLSKRNLKKIPTRKFKTGEEPETCAICLDDFIEDEKLRVLPCRHVYHCKCIDPWLTRNRKVCPMCKRRVGEKGSDSESSGDERSPPILVDQGRYRQLQEDPSGGSMIVAYSPTSERASSSQVLVDVHHDETIGSREHLVAPEAGTHERTLSDDEEEHNTSSISTSLKDRLSNLSKGFMQKVGRSPARIPREPLVESATDNEDTSGEDNGGFDECSLHTAIGEEQPAAITTAEQPASVRNEGVQDETANQFSDPFESSSNQPRE